MRRLLEYCGYRFMAFFVPLLPRAAAAWLGRALGRNYFRFSTRARTVAFENLRLAMPDLPDQKRVLRRVHEYQGVALLDALWCSRLARDDDSYLSLGEDGAMAEAIEILKSGRGAVMATAHFGSWEMFCACSASVGIPNTLVIARKVRNERIDRHMQAGRQRHGNRMVNRKKAMKACLRELRGGGFVVSVMDIAVLPKEGGLFSDFFGIPAITSSAIPYLALRTNAPLFFVVCRPVDGGKRYVLEGERIRVDRDADQKVEAARLTDELNRALERKVREHPDCWLWSYKRWKWRPAETGQEHFPAYSLWTHTLW
ncbi:MAG: hypothetical protein OER88_03015 [Planctomycetota bacterium]|nr:hypothetical protein [Planctomycetota bacterium]